MVSPSILRNVMLVHKFPPPSKNKVKMAAIPGQIFAPLHTQLYILPGYSGVGPNIAYSLW